MTSKNFAANGTQKEPVLLEGIVQQPIDRRTFLKTTALVGGAAAVAGTIPYAINQAGESLIPARALAKTSAAGAYSLGQPENVIYSVCLNCHTSCTIKAKVQDGVMVKIDGNPYSAMCLLPNLPGETTPADAAKIDGKICPKGQAGVQIAYDPYRVRQVLKRAGKRGENKWQAVNFNQFIDEVVTGGDLFGEGQVDGLNDIYKLRDPDLAKELSADAAAVAAGDMAIADFKTKHADHLDLLIDPEHPDLGPVNNQFVFLGGRVEHGRKELAKRFTSNSFGSVNFFLHTTICEQSHHIAYELMSGKTHFKPDYLNAEFVLLFGTSIFEANFGPTPTTEMVTDSLVRRNFKLAVVDPRLSKTAAKAWKWVPIKPGADGALAMGMVRWIIENERYDEAYLRATNTDAANAINETNFTDATNLVRTDNMVFLTPEDAGLTPPEGGARVVMVEGVPTLSTAATAGDLFVDAQVSGIPVKSVMQLLKERAEEMTLEEYADFAGIRVADIEELADEFTSHGKKASAELYRGPVQHTNGYYNGTAIVTLNVLIGNTDWKGGITTGGSHWHEDGSKKGQPFPKSDVAGGAPGGLSAFGIMVNREKATYEKSTLFNGYPAKRPWYPFTYELYQEVIPSAAMGYPYPVKAMFIQKGTPVLASPAGHAMIEMLRDSKKIPLLIACDVVVGETSMYADYILPDLTYMERWGTSHTTPAILTNNSKVRQPIIAPLTEIVTVDGEEMPISMEAFMIAVGKQMGLPGTGKNGLGEGWDFNRPEDFFLALISNITFGDKEDGSDTTPAADDEEMRIFREARKHLPKAVFDEETWKKAVPANLWPNVVWVLNRGGRFEPSNKAYKGDKVAHVWKGHWNLFVEKVAKGKNAMNGERFSGLPLVEAVKDASGALVDDGAGYDLHLITYKEITGGQSRTHGSAWLQTAVLPENHVVMARRDAVAKGLNDGDRVRIISASLPDARFELGDGRTYEVKGKVKTVEGMRPGTIGISWSYGHWAYGSNDVEIDGQVIKGDPRRATGSVPNPSMRIDPVLGDVCLTDPIGGSASFYDTKVRVEKV